MSKRDERSETLNNQLERLSDSVENASDQISNSMSYSVTIETGLESHFSQLKDSIDSHQDSVSDLANAIRDGAGSIFTGLVVGGIFALGAKALGLAVERANEIRKKTDLIKSILRLQDKYPYLTFRFIMERASVKGASDQELKGIINELIDDNILLEYRCENINALKIDPESKELKAYWDWLEDLRKSLSK